jgi:hypothetical protein
MVTAFVDLSVVQPPQRQQGDREPPIEPQMFRMFKIRKPA